MLKVSTQKIREYELNDQLLQVETPKLFNDQQKAKR